MQTIDVIHAIYNFIVRACHYFTPQKVYLSCFYSSVMWQVFFLLLSSSQSQYKNSQNKLFPQINVCNIPVYWPVCKSESNLHQWLDGKVSFGWPIECVDSRWSGQRVFTLTFIGSCFAQRDSLAQSGLGTVVSLVVWWGRARLTV